MNQLEPLKFKPIFKYRIWGGEQLKEVLHKEYTEENIGESWELSGVAGDVSVVSEGSYKGKSLTDLIDSYREDLLGASVMKRFGMEFPILIKFIDAAKDLSIQVHPNDELAKQRHQSFGKTEMWYVIQADKQANLIVGFKEGVTQEHFQEALKKQQLESLLNYHKVQKGAAFLIPTGTIHAIGAGVMLAEIQQTSDVTYRVYDFNRKDKDGNTRELHTELALDALNYQGVDGFKQVYREEVNKSNSIVDSPYFITKYLPIKDVYEMDLSQRDSFTILMAVNGNSKIKYGVKTYELNYGETILIPASLNHLTLEGASTLLEIYL
jgi:mannose-6-phosphate isomerase